MKTNQYNFTGKTFFCLFFFLFFCCAIKSNSNSKENRPRDIVINCVLVFVFLLNFRYKFSVLALTYVAYTCYHLTRKPISVVKTVLHRNCSLVDSSQQIRSVTDASSEETWCDYAPFGRSILFFITHKQTKQTNENRNGFHSLVQSSNEKYFIKRKMK